jgi:hypothetical protein
VNDPDWSSLIDALDRLYRDTPSEARKQIKNQHTVVVAPYTKHIFFPLRRLIDGWEGRDMLAARSEAQETNRYSLLLREAGFELVDSNDPQHGKLQRSLEDLLERKFETRPSPNLRTFWVMSHPLSYQGEFPISKPSENTDFREAGDRQITRVEKERNRAARDACLSHYREHWDGKLLCIVCNIDFGQTYGKLGEGFIHVHHLDPLAEAKSERIVSPENDLVPVCPNCHAMIHRGGVTRTLDAVRRVLKRG